MPSAGAQALADGGDDDFVLQLGREGGERKVPGGTIYCPWECVGQPVFT